MRNEWLLRTLQDTTRGEVVIGPVQVKLGTFPIVVLRWLSGSRSVVGTWSNTFLVRRYRPHNHVS
jgi:hypothetical protein